MFSVIIKLSSWAAGLTLFGRIETVHRRKKEMEKFIRGHIRGQTQYAQIEESAREKNAITGVASNTA